MADFPTIRRWAESNNYTHAGARGRLPGHVIRAYYAAHPEDSFLRDRNTAVDTSNDGYGSTTTRTTIRPATGADSYDALAAENRAVIEANAALLAKVAAADDKPNATGSLDELIANIARDAARGAIDETKVRDILASEMGTFRAEIVAQVADKIAELKRPVVYTITVDGREPITMEGRQHAVFPKVLDCVAERRHVYLVGPPGTGKSTLAENVAKALGLTFSSVSCYATMPASQLWGYKDATGQYHTTEFRERYESGGIFLVDEIDNGHAGITASLNQGLANHVAPFADGMVERHKDFICIAAANTYGDGATTGAIGRNALDAATKDRFMFIDVNIDEDLETDLAIASGGDTEATRSWIALVRRYRYNAKAAGLKVVVSPRASIDGAAMINKRGWTVKETIAARLTHGLTAEQIAKVSA